MLAHKYYQYKQCREREQVIFSFSGFISEGILFALGEVLKKKLTLEKTDPNRIRRVFSVFVELVQNIIHYSAEHVDAIGNDPDELGSGIIIVGSQDEHFYIGCGNVIPPDDAMQLREHLEFLQRLNQEELRLYFRKRLQEEVDDSTKGSNLGLIEIARRSSTPIEFDFLPIAAGKVFYCIKSII